MLLIGQAAFSDCYTDDPDLDVGGMEAAYPAERLGVSVPVLARFCKFLHLAHEAKQRTT